MGKNIRGIVVDAKMKNFPKAIMMKIIKEYTIAVQLLCVKKINFFSQNRLLQMPPANILCFTKFNHLIHSKCLQYNNKYFSKTLINTEGILKCPLYIYIYIY